MKYLLGLVRRAASPVCVLVAFALLAAPSAWAQSQNAGIKIHSIEVRYTGPETISRERILAQMRTKVGQVYSDTVIEQDIRNLYSTGQVQNVRIFGEPAGQEINVIVAVQTRATVHDIEINGATRIAPKSLRKMIKVKLNAPLNEDALGQARQDIIDEYKAKGYNDVDVQYKVETEEERGKARVVFTITEGTKGVISRIHFEGNTHFSENTLRKQMKTRGKTMISFLDKSGRIDEAQFQQDLDSLREWYQNHGYIDVEIKEIRRERSAGHMIMIIPIVEGQKYYIGKIIVKGTKATTPEKVRMILKIKEGGVYSPKDIRDDAKKIADAYGGGGFVDLVVQPHGSPAGPGKINVTFEIEEGAKAFVQRINIVGNTRTKDKVIRREVLVAPGDVYSTTRVDISKKRLDNLGYFSRVETYPEDTNVPGRKDLTVEVEEKRTGSLNFGVGFSTIDSFVGFVELTQGNFDLTNWPTFTGGGQKFRLRLQGGQQRKDFVLSLIEPWFLDRPLSLGGELFYREADFLSAIYDQRNYGFSITARRPLTRFLSMSLEYRLEEIDIFNVAPTASAAIQSQKGANTRSSITPSFIWDARDNPILTRKGTRIVFTPFVAGGFLGGDTQTYGGDLEISQYFHLPSDLILLLNGEVASVDTWGSGNNNGLGVPIYDRLFLGGSNNLRGFNFRDVGPKDVNGEPLGGQTLARWTVELTFPIIEKVRGAVFTDAGFVDPNAFDFGGRLASDAGIGLRLDLPIGPIRIDYGFPIQTGGNNSRNGKFNFNVGYQF
ncbi:MAG: outer membrane protein assembly factor BamA [Chthoniobacterales bacterium]